MRRALSPASITSPERITTQIPPGASLSRNPRIRITLPPPSCLQTGAHVRRRALGFPFLSPQARTEVSSSLLVKNLVDHYGDAPFGGGGHQRGGEWILQGKGSKQPWSFFSYLSFRPLLWICSPHLVRTLDSNPRDVSGIKHVHMLIHYKHEWR